MPDLRLKAGRGSGLASLIVKCIVEDCGREQSLQGAFGDRALNLHCRGHRPWLETDEDCTARVRAVQRGASNLYFGLLESALSVPPWSDPLQRALGIYWSDIAELPDAERRRDLVELLRLSEKTGIEFEELIAQIEARLGRLETAPDIRREEYDQLVEPMAGQIDAGNDFLVERETVPSELKSRLGSLSRVSRLREVRVLRGFTRLSPYAGSDDNGRIAALAAVRHDWLPGIELRGEGIFIALAGDALTAWESREDVRARTDELDFRAAAANGDGVPSSEPARLILLHTLAHVLMAELSLECGYTFAALRERIYAGDSMAGVLIYTGSPDSEGTLGGLVRQGQADRFARVLVSALKRAEWCANDPLCADARLSLSDTRSLAACHACALAPETSCERFNRDLDRGLLVGVPEREQIGYFRDLL